MRTGHLLPELLVRDIAPKCSDRQASAQLYQNARVAGARARRSPVETNGGRILAVMRPFTGYEYSDLQRKSGLSEMQFGPALDALIRSCHVEKTLDWHGPFYSLPC